MAAVKFYREDIGERTQMTGGLIKPDLLWRCTDKHQAVIVCEFVVIFLLLIITNIFFEAGEKLKKPR